MATLWVYVAFDGDHIGREVERAGMADDPERLRQLSHQIEAGNEVWKSWALAQGGEVISLGGDEGNVKVTADKLGDLPDLRERYAQAVGAPVSVGVGTRLSEAGRALMAAKHRGGDRVTLYDPSIEDELAQIKDQSEDEKISEAYLEKAIAAPQYTPEQRAQYKAQAKPAPQPVRPLRPTPMTIEPGAAPTNNQKEFAANMRGLSPEAGVQMDQYLEAGLKPGLPPTWGKPASKEGKYPAEDTTGPDGHSPAWQQGSMYQTKAAADRAGIAARASQDQNRDIGGATYGPDQWANVGEAALQQASPIPEMADPSDPSRMLHFKWRIADPASDNFGQGRQPWSRALDVWSRRVDHAGQPTWIDSRTRGFFPLTASGFVNHGDVSSTSQDQDPEHIQQIIRHIHGSLHAPGNDTWKSELAKDEPALNKPNAGGGMTGPSTAPAAGAVSPTPEGSEHSENEALQGMIADNPAPPTPEAPGMDQMHDLLGQVASSQGQQDQADQEAQGQQQDAQKGQGDLKSQVLKILKTFQDRKQELEQLQQQDPELYQSMVGMIQVLIAGARQLFGTDDSEGAQQVAGNESGKAAGKDEGQETKKSEHHYKLEGDAVIETSPGGHSLGHGPVNKDEPKECKHFYGKGGNKCLKCKAVKDLDKASLEAGKTGRHNVVLPPGSQKDASASGTGEAGKIKVQHPEDGKTSWVSVRAGQVMSQDGHAISSRNPGGK